MKKRIIASLLIVCGLAACAGRVPGSIYHPAQNTALLTTPGSWTLSVEAPLDERPPAEKNGVDPETTAFVFLLFYIYKAERGNLVTSPVELGLAPMADLHRATIEYLARSNVFRSVQAAPAPADFLLRATVRNLFASRYVSSSFSMAWSKDSADVSSAKAQHAPFGNAVVDYELVDQRGGKREVVWRDTVSGFAAGSPEDPKFAVLPSVARAAVASLLGRLARALHLTSDRLATRERSAPPPAVAPGFLFYVQRTSPTREGIDLVTIEFPTGRIAAARRVEADALPPGKPGEWLLSRRSPSGELIIGERYEAMARALAEKFDLRRIDDAYFYHFFGLRGRKPAMPPAPPPVPTEAPPPIQ
jgi:hypothetical protein